MVSVKESEIFGNLLNSLELLTGQIKDKGIQDQIQNIIEQFDEVIC